VIGICNFKGLEVKYVQSVCRVLRQGYRVFKQGIENQGDTVFSDKTAGIAL
jgi:hypothetical protein